MAAYLVMPIIDVPVMGLSLSAPIFFVIALNVLFKPPESWLLKFRGWILLAFLIWLGVFISVVGNGILSGGIDVDTIGMLNIIRFAYWMLTFVITAYFVSRGNMLERVSNVLGWAVFGLGLLRLFEAIVWGKIGAWTNTQFLTQNNYGFGFSMYFPFLLAPIISSRGGKRLLWIIRLLVVGSAVLINGSRGSWIGVAVGIAVFSVLFVIARPQKIGWSIVIVTLSVLLILGVQYAPAQIASTFGERFATFQALDADKSYMIRQLMIQKGLRLFEQSPIIGVGVSRFTKESTPLDIPQGLEYASQKHFDVKSAHNSYIAFLAETGLAGSIPFAILLLILGLRGMKSSIKLTQHGQVYALSIYAGFLGMSVHMWGISSLTNTGNWFLYGLVTAVIVIAKREAKQSAWE